MVIIQAGPDHTTIADHRTGYAPTTTDNSLL
ncbi:uncharacterized protein G2W53_028882 [Senna tora]|uniref:Uncharacterized protein n=1 Tax=Senna tora TaxID=362788 RepID=A0A834T1V2_9FABA|nr:uncharacterized protein G2W53_028882 [Senna tora]